MSWIFNEWAEFGQKEKQPEPAYLGIEAITNKEEELLKQQEEEQARHDMEVLYSSLAPHGDE